MIDITRDQFEAAIHAATSCDDTIYDAVTPYMERAWNRAQRFLTPTGVDAMDNDESLASEVRDYVSEVGFLLAMRHLDLVLTDSGFGIVSNDHIAPASAERVNALEREVAKAADCSYCNIIRILIEGGEWGSQTQAKYIISSLLWDREDIAQRLGKADPTNEEYVTMRRQVFDEEFKIFSYLGYTLQEELLVAMLTSSAKPIQQHAIELIKSAVALNLSGNEKTREETKMRLINWFDGEKDSFPSYTSSPEYKARNMKRHENTEDSPAFFFG